MKIYDITLHVFVVIIERRKSFMLKHGQIKFTKKAAQFAGKYFKKKKIESFLVAIKRGEQKPSGYKGFYKQLLGEKQDPSSTYKVYTNNIEKAKNCLKYC